jgi:electron transfer flavoprotein alpha/beta subunit
MDKGYPKNKIRVVYNGVEDLFNLYQNNKKLIRKKLNLKPYEIAVVVVGRFIFDKYAIEEGLRIKERLGGGKVIALAAGTPGKYKILREALSMGCDDAVIVESKGVCDDQDNRYSISSILSKAIIKMGDIDLIISSGGSDEMPDDTEKKISDYLELEQVDSVARIEEIKPGGITVNRRTAEGFNVIEVPFPALVTLDGRINTPRVPTVKDKIKARRKEIPVLNVEGFDLTESTSAYDESICEDGQNFSSGEIPDENIHDKFDGYDNLPAERPEKNEAEKMVGRSSSNHLVHFKDLSSCVVPGDIIQARITHAGQHSLQGEIVSGSK